MEDIISSRKHFLCMCMYMSLSADKDIKKLEFTPIILTKRDLHARMLQMLTHHLTSLSFEVIGPGHVWVYGCTLKDISKFCNMPSLSLKKINLLSGSLKAIKDKKVCLLAPYCHLAGGDEVHFYLETLPI